MWCLAIGRISYSLSIIANIFEYLLYVSYCTECFTCMISFIYHNNTVQKVLLFSQDKTQMYEISLRLHRSIQCIQSDSRVKSDQTSKLYCFHCALFFVYTICLDFDLANFLHLLPWLVCLYDFLIGFAPEPYLTSNLASHFLVSKPPHFFQIQCDLYFL